MQLKRLLSAIAYIAFATTAIAQMPVNGTTYCLPQTAMRFSVLIEKTHYEPGQFAEYAEKYMKLFGTRLEAGDTYRIVGMKMMPTALPDTSKQYTLNLDRKPSISEINRSSSGILLAINAQGRQAEKPQAFVPARQPKPLNPTDYMNEETLRAGSTAKMAELIARDIYDIRDSRNELTRGNADYMPKDGEQLKIMMDNLSTQEKALMQVFEGTTSRDTTETVFQYLPTKEVEGEVLFRFSKVFGLVDADDLSGEPYYISISDLHTVQDATPIEEKKPKDDINLYVNLASKIKATITHNGKTEASYELAAGQFGRTEKLSAELFGKKQTTLIVLDPLTGAIEKIESKPIEK